MLMSKENENIKLVPELRFLEFEKEGEWNQSVLGSVAEFSKGKGVSKKDIVPNGKFPCIRYGELYTDYGEVISEVISKTNVPKEELIFSKGNEVIIPSSGETRIDIARASCILQEGIALGGDLNIIKSKINGVFLSYLLNGPKKREIAKMAQGVSVMHLYNSQLVDLNIEIPKPKEQHKIAATLTSLDYLIAAENEKLYALQEHKKGLLQQLFPAEGEKVPKLRFGEFSGAWEETTLVQVADYENGKAHEKEIAESGKYIVVNSKFISSEGEVMKLSDSINCETSIGDILMVLSDIPNGKAIAKCFYVNKNDTYTVNQRICRITATDIDSRFLFYLLNRNPYFLSFDDGVKQTNLRKDTVLNCPLLKPTDPKEQEKIADCIDSINSQNEKQFENIESLKEHKKGLMQQMFPNLNTQTK